MHLSPFSSAALLACFCLLLPSALPAQSVIVPNVIFTGAPAYQPADLLAVTGLKPGSVVAPDAIQLAAQHLNDTGLFTDIRFASTSKGLVFTLTPMPAEAVLPAAFTNLVWWQPAELNALLKARVPLFVGSVPTTGSMQDLITAALTTLVSEKGIPNPHITAILTSLPGVPPSIAFSLDNPAVLIKTFQVQHATPSVQSRLAALSARVAGKPWVEPASRIGIYHDLADIYRDEGYLDIEVTSFNHSAPAVTPGTVTLDLTAGVSEGEPYRVSSLTWPGSDMMSVADFNKTAKLHPEDIASQSALRESLQSLARAFFSHGYQDAKVLAPPVLDRATHHVAYTVTVAPGDQYRIRTVKTVGLTETQQKEFNSFFRIHPGDPYDSVYVGTFFIKNTALHSLAGHSVSYKALSDPDTHLVDLTLTFTRDRTLVSQQP